MSKVLNSRWMLLAVTVIILLICASLYNNTHQLRLSTVTLNELQKEVDTQNQAVDTLQRQLDTAKSPFAKEKIMRDQLLLQKPGEYVVQLPDLPVPEVTPIPSPKTLTPLEEWQKLLFTPN